MIDLSKYGSLLVTIIEAISSAAKAAGESEAVVLKRVTDYLAEQAKDSTDPLLESILKDYPGAKK